MKSPLFFSLLFLCLEAFAQTPAHQTIDDQIAHAWAIHEDPDSQALALELANKALNESNNIGYLKGQGKAISILGQIALLNKASDEALRQYVLCLQVRRQDGDTCGVAATYLNMAKVYVDIGDYIQAIWCAQYGERILLDKVEKRDQEELTAQRNLAVAQERLSAIYSDEKEYLLALKYGIKAKQQSEILKDTNLIANSLYNLANRYYSCQSIAGQTPKQVNSYRDSALLLYRQANTLYEYLEDNVQMAEINNATADVFIDEGYWDSAWVYLGRAKDLYLSEADSASAFYVWKNMGRLRLQQKAYEEALLYLKTAERLGDSEPDTYINLYSYLYETYKGLGNDKASNLYLEKVEQMKDMLYRNKQDIFNKKVRSDLELREKVTRQKLEGERVKNQIVALVALILGLLALIIWLAYRNVQRRNREKSLEIDALIRSSDIRYVKEVEAKMDKIALELHAEIGNCGSSLGMAVTSLHQNLEKYPDLQRQAAGLKVLAGESFNELRNISHSLGTSVLEKTGLVTVVKHLIQQIQAHRSVNIEFSPSGNQTEISYEVGRTLYRIIQNLLNNSLTHGAPKNININLSEEQDALIMSYSDDGKGFDLESYKPGAGLQDIDRMANAIHAKVNGPVSAIGKGFFMQLSIPTAPSHEPE